MQTAQLVYVQHVLTEYRLPIVLVFVILLS